MGSMVRTGIMNLAQQGSVIPAVRSVADFQYAARHTAAPALILLFGDINILGELMALGQAGKKRLILHLDLFEGIGKDRAGIKFLARLGVPALITTKPHLAKLAREEGLIVIQRLFMMDSDSFRTGINMLKGFKPDAVEILPAFVPGDRVRDITREIGIPVLAGGLVKTPDDVARAVLSGVYAISSSTRSLWR